MEGEMNQDGETSEREGTENPQVISYQAPWPMFALAFTHKKAHPFRLAIGSFHQDSKSEVQIVELNENKQLQRRAHFAHEYSPTKLLFVPDESGSLPDLLASSSDCLKIWKIHENKEVTLQLNLKNDNQFSAPLTSFDWNPQVANLIGTSSIDTTCTMWDIGKGEAVTQIIAHDKQVYDIHFSRDRNLFASVGADGSVRQFDIRDLAHSCVLYYTDHRRPILKLAWNRQEPSSFLLACIEMETNYVTLLDSRKPIMPVMHLSNHRDCVNALAWAPQSAVHMCTTGDDCKAYIWDISSGAKGGEFQAPLLQYKADNQICNLAWSSVMKEWLAICYVNNLQVLRL